MTIKGFCGTFTGMWKHKPAFLLGRVFLALLLYASSSLALAVPAEEEFLQRLRANYSALLQARAEFDRLRKSGQLDAVEEVDYAAWIRQMSEQVGQDCNEFVRFATVPLPDDLPCDQFSAAGPGPAEIDLTVESTAAEKTNRMIEQLNTSLGEFDERLLREQDRIKAQSPRTESVGGGLAGTAGDNGSAAASAEQGQGEQQSQQNRDDGERTASSEQGAQGKPLPAANKAVPDDIPDGSDDDVVARQLREAALKETDPVLKKKLWEEYRRYKTGTAGPA